MSDTANDIRTTFLNRLYILRDKSIREENGIEINATYLDSKKLSHLIEKKWLSEKDIGDISGVSGQAVNNWSKSQYPSSLSLACLAKAFTVPLEWIAGAADTMSFKQDNQSEILDNENKEAIKDGIGFSYETEKEWIIFQKYGFSLDAFKNLSLLKEHYSMEGIMEGINRILEYKTESHYVNNSSEETHTILKLHKLEDEYPALKAINSFFTLYRTGTDCRLSSNAMNFFSSSVLSNLEDDEKKSAFIKMRRYLSTVERMSVEECDTIRLRLLEDHLKKCKAAFVLESVKNCNSIETDDKLSEEQKFTALNSLFALNQYYNEGREFPHIEGVSCDFHNLSNIDEENDAE